MKKLMTLDSKSIRKVFLDFFADKAHRIVPSAPMVVKDDPTLMFTNAGMNQFKDYFLGNKTPVSSRIADTQKCLRVSGKHNDLEEVGRDSYHHTMFEMLGNWSFGDYFKEDAINWAWELLTEIYGLDKDRLFVTVFGGDAEDGLESDVEARKLWSKWLPDERILDFGKEDNFWEMGDSGPCGPCSEIHYDLRDAKDRAASPGAPLVNLGDPGVVEIWNLVFIQFNRKADGALENLPQKHVDTGMGFERLVRALQDKQSNYDTDVFSGMIQFVSQATGVPYTGDYSGKSYSDIAMRVIADHVRALYFGIADGQLPSNTGAGYVLRRILRRAVRYYYSFLGVKAPLMFRLVPLLSEYFSDVFPEATGQSDFIENVIREEENSFLRTLDAGMGRFEGLTATESVISGADAFELYDTFGFPLDLTQLMADERGLKVDVKGYEEALAGQKHRSREDAQKSYGDWVQLSDGTSEFVGYDTHETDGVRILKYRHVEAKGKVLYHLVLNETPFYPEGGGQVGDTGTLAFSGKSIKVIDTIRENDLPIAVTTVLPDPPDALLQAKIDSDKRIQTEYNHSATHLLHAALRSVLGTHVQQRGSLVNDEHLRFDFSHFQKLTEEQLQQVERMVNARIRANISRGEDRAMPIEKAKEAGAMMLFGEKYGDTVRMITFDPDFSVELCGGCHVDQTGRIGLFKIVSESAIAAGVRRIEAVTGETAERYMGERLNQLEEVSHLLKRPADIVSGVQNLLDENKLLKKQLEELQQRKIADLYEELLDRAEESGSIKFIAQEVSLTDGKAIKDLVFRLTSSRDNLVVLLSATSDGKVQLHLGVSKPLAEAGRIDASKLIRTLSKHIKGGGGG
jgi:alanyl-tRNA synthetase